MAITLNDIKIGRADKYDRMVIDTFMRKSAILAAMPFDNCIHRAVEVRLLTGISV